MYVSVFWLLFDTKSEAVWTWHIVDINFFEEMMNFTVSPPHCCWNPSDLYQPFGRPKETVAPWLRWNASWMRPGWRGVLQDFPNFPMRQKTSWNLVNPCKKRVKTRHFAAFCRLGRVEIWHFQTLHKGKPVVFSRCHPWNCPTTVGSKQPRGRNSSRSPRRAKQATEHRSCLFGFSQRDSPHHSFKCDSLIILATVDFVFLTKQS